MTPAVASDSGPELLSDDEDHVDAWLEAIVRENYRALYAYAMSLTRNPADAADLTQQTTVILATRWRQIKDRSKTKSWLFTILYREFIRLNKRNKRQVSLHEDDYHEDPSTPATQESTHDGRSAIDAIHSLPEPHRSVLSLYYLDDLSYREIAEVLELPTGTVMSRLSRAKDAIRQILCPTS
jgi:RNA polymerase sigma-70 factor (ECF subfamily)